MADTSQVSLRRRPLYKRTDADVDAAEELTRVIDYARSLRARIKGRTRPAVAVPDDKMLPTKSVLQAKRLPRTGAGANQLLLGAVQAAEAEDAAEPIEVEAAVMEPFEAGDDSEALLVSGAGNGYVRTIYDENRRPAGWLWVAGVVGLLLVCLLSYWLFRVRSSNSDHSASQAAQTTVFEPTHEAIASDDALKVADAAIDAMQRGDLAKASNLFAQAKRQGISLPGMSYQGALLALRQGDVDAADHWIERSIAANESVAECLYLQANEAAYNGDYAGSASNFEEAARAKPFDPRYFFFWAESLRRNGNPAQAIPQFEQALRCRPSAGDAELISFKLGLAKIETGTDTRFKAQLAEKLSHEPVSGFTYLLGAADLIDRSAYPEAAADMLKAAKLMPVVTLQAYLRDFLFRASIEQPAIAAAYATLFSVAGAIPAPLLKRGTRPQRPMRAKVLVDPATRGLAETDPAVW